MPRRGYGEQYESVAEEKFGKQSRFFIFQMCQKIKKTLNFLEPEPEMGPRLTTPLHALKKKSTLFKILFQHLTNEIKKYLLFTIAFFVFSKTIINLFKTKGRVEKRTTTLRAQSNLPVILGSASPKKVSYPNSKIIHMIDDSYVKPVRGSLLNARGMVKERNHNMGN